MLGEGSVFSARNLGSILGSTAGLLAYPAPIKRWYSPMKVIGYMFTVRLLQQTMEINTQSMDQLREVLFGSGRRPTYDQDTVNDEVRRLFLCFGRYGREKERGWRVRADLEARIALFLGKSKHIKLSIAGDANVVPKIHVKSLGNLFAEACKAAGIRKSAHGLRKAAATNAANHGATVAELEAIFGWAGGQMASLYTRSANRRALSAGAMNKLSRTETETSIPAPTDKVRAPERKH